jgi:hypothetical protein
VVHYTIRFHVVSHREQRQKTSIRKRLLFGTITRKTVHGVVESSFEEGEKKEERTKGLENILENEGSKNRSGESNDTSHDSFISELEFAFSRGASRGGCGCARGGRLAGSGGRFGCAGSGRNRARGRSTGSCANNSNENQLEVKASEMSLQEPHSSPSRAWAACSSAAVQLACRQAEADDWKAAFVQTHVRSVLGSGANMRATRGGSVEYILTS